MRARWSQGVHTELGRYGVTGLCALLVHVLFWSPLEPACAETLRMQVGRDQERDNPVRAWNFDEDKAGEPPIGFSAGATGNGQTQPLATWKIEADPEAPSAPHVLVQSGSCPNAGCLHVLLADGTSYEYPDLMVHLRVLSEGPSSGAGVVLGARDARNFYAVTVDLASNAIEVIRVLDGQMTVIDRVPVKHEWLKRQGFGETLARRWHVLRVQRNTIISKKYFDIFFDGRPVRSVSDDAFSTGQIGLATRGQAVVRFDNFHALQLISNRPLSPRIP